MDSVFRVALAALCGYALLLLWVNLGLHVTPFYAVETDLLGDYIPAARDLLGGRMQAAQYAFKGFGYPLLLATFSFPCGGDFYLAARVLNVAAALAGAWCSFLLIRRFLGPGVGLAVLLGLAVNPVYLRAAVEAGTDLPTFALSIAATHLVLQGRGSRAVAAAGLLSGFAIITRYNAAFLVPAAAAVLLARPPRLPRLAAYAAGLAVSVVPWLVTNQALTGNAFTNENWQNVARDIYGRDTNWDAFWKIAAGQFHSLRDVALYDPRLFFSRLGANMATHWLQDIHRLLPVWLGVPALAGLALCWWRRRGWPGMLGHFALGYLSLVSVFYGPRFFLYLLPFYLSGAGALVLMWSPGRPAAVRSPGRSAPAGAAVPAVAGRAWLPALRWVLLAGLLAPSGARAWADIQALLADAPHEVRVGGELLRSLGRPGETVMARKPHVAYFAGMNYVELPAAADIFELVQAARASGAGYLFYSGVEKHLRPQFDLLEDRDVRLPGLAQVAARSLPRGRSFTIYRFTDEPVTESQMQAPLAEALERHVAGRPGLAAPRLVLSGQLMAMGRFREALGHLAVADSLSPGAPRVIAFQAHAHLCLGEYEAAARYCEKGLRMGQAAGLFHDELGTVRLAQRRPAEAREHFQAAVALEPANIEYRVRLGIACLELGDLASAARELEAGLASSPDAAPARYFAARCRLRMGDRARALQLIEGRHRPGAQLFPPLEALADSVRRGLLPQPG
ncbi:MAG: tetratricopeptide repeat protein [Candidatus Eisenbacteria bacterium]|nr:tetratricopeptide repeat protein [Candidatus Eisenbacteria bacterium]